MSRLTIQSTKPSIIACVIPLSNFQPPSSTKPQERRELVEKNREKYSKYMTGLQGHNRYQHKNMKAI